MSEKIEQLILKTLTIIPGVVGIAPMNFDKKAYYLKEKNFANGIKVVKKSKGVELSIAIIIEHSINMNVVATEINNAIDNILSKQNISLISLKIYVRGVE